jgi:hypothetical protein
MTDCGHKRVNSLEVIHKFLSAAGRSDQVIGTDFATRVSRCCGPLRTWTRSPRPRAAGRCRPFDEHADVPFDVVARLAEEAQDLPDLSGFPVVWHDPADAVATLDAILSAPASDPARVGREDPEYLARCLEAIRQTLQQAVTRKTRFNFTIA